MSGLRKLMRGRARQSDRELVMTPEQEDELIDKMAEHLREHSPPWFPRKEKWEKLEERAREEWRKQAIAALSLANPIIRDEALEDAARACESSFARDDPSVWKLREPTQDELATYIRSLKSKGQKP